MGITWAVRMAKRYQKIVCIKKPRRISSENLGGGGDKQIRASGVHKFPTQACSHLKILGAKG